MDKQYEYSGGIERFFAAVIDGLIIAASVFIIAIPFVMLGLISGDENLSPVLFFTGICCLVTIPILVGYYIHAIYAAGHNGQSPGKKMMGIKIIDENGNVPSAGKLIGRRLVFDLLNMLTSLVLIVILVTEKKQGIHDMVAKTYVVKVK